MTESRHSLLFSLLLIKALLIALIIAYYIVGLSPDEAQYWTWSQDLAWGYYSKPPGIAWQIWFTTYFFGDTVLGIRIGGITIAFLLALTLHHLAYVSGTNYRSSFWAGIVLAFSPLGIYLSLATTTDGGSILFLTLAVITIARGLREEKGPNYILTGIWVLLGALYKWTAFIFWPFLFLFLFFYPSLRKKSLFLGIAISLLSLLPTLIWNIFHDFATFKHVYYHVGGDGKGGNFFDFLGTQIALISPIYFILFVLALFYLFWKVKKSPPSLLFCGTWTLAVALYFILSLFKNVQPNWAAYLYPPGFAVLAWYACEKLRTGRVWLHIGTWFSIVSVLGALAIPWIQSHNVFPSVSLPYRINPLRQNLGWDRLAPALAQAGYKSETDFLFSDKYQMASLLSFYGPEKKRAYFFNLGQSRKNQFSYWPQMAAQEVGKSGYFAISENVEAEALPWYESHYLERLAPYFARVEYVGAYPLFEAYGKPVKHLILFKGVGYNGTFPKDPEKW